MKALVAVALFTGMATSFAFAQGPINPTDLLGQTVQEVQRYGNCKGFEDAPDFYACRLKKHPKEIFGGIKVASEGVVFVGHKVQQVNVEVAHKTIGGRYASDTAVRDFLSVLYGKPDSPATMPSSSTFRTTTYGSENASTTLNSTGKSQTMFAVWTRPEFTVRWSSHIYESYRDMVDERTNSVANILGVSYAETSEQITFEAKAN